MSEPRKRPGVAFWATVLVVVFGLYAVSLGPAYWLVRFVFWDAPSAHDAFHVAYQPLYYLARRSTSVADAMAWYMYLPLPEPEPEGR